MQNDTTERFCGFEQAQNKGRPEHRAIIWSHGPYAGNPDAQHHVVGIMACENEAQLRFLVEDSYPGIDYRPYPTTNDGT